MLQRMSCNKIFTSLPSSFWLGHMNQFSNDTTKDVNNISKSVNIEESLKNNPESLHSVKVSQLLEQATTYKDANDKSWATTPYPKDLPMKNTEEIKPFKDPKDTYVFLFPGQGSIKVGMVKQYMQFPFAKELFETANEILNYNLLELCLNGSQQKLNRTEFNQAATVVSSLAALEKLREERSNVFDNCVAVAGYSVGEISALIVSGVITFEDGIKLVCIRGKAMQYASEKVPQGMLSVTCTAKSNVSKACVEAEKWAMEMGVEEPICRVASFLCTQRKILAGNIEALEYIEKYQKTFGLSNVNRLPVSGAFHTPLMTPSVKAISKILNSIELNEPRCLVYSNYKAKPYRNLQTVKKYIVKQIISPIKWEQCMQHIYSRPEDTAFPNTFDVGSEGRMRTILRLINVKAAKCCSIV